MQAETYPFVMRPLPVEYDGLEPLLDEDTLKYHHDRHYKAYIDQLNDALADYPDLQQKSLYELLRGLSGLPAALKPKVRKFGGGSFNHELYFDSLQAAERQEPEGLLKEAIERDFGSVKQWKDLLKEEAMAVFGSGWIFLVSDSEGKLSLQTAANQDTPELKYYLPILNLDMWEHAYYLQYQNCKSEYINSWLKVINWRKVSRRYECFMTRQDKGACSCDEE